VFIVSSQLRKDEVIHAIITVFALPPKESFKSHVSLESL